MAQTFVVEDGTGLETATSYVDLTFANQYVDDFLSSDGVWTGAADSSKQDWLNRASFELDVNHADNYKGIRVRRDQNLQHPRTGIVDNDGYSRDSNSVVVEVKRATVEAAVLIAKGNSLTSEVESNAGTIKSQSIKVAGAVEKSTTYETGQGPTPTRPLTPRLVGILRPILKPSKAAQIPVIR